MILDRAEAAQKILRLAIYFFYNMVAVASAVTHELVQKSLVGEALEHGPVAVFVADDDGRYLAVNAYACELLGYTRSELLEPARSDVAVDPEAQANYAEMRRTGSRTGMTRLRRQRRDRDRDALPRLADHRRRDAGLHRHVLARRLS